MSKNVEGAAQMPVNQSNRFVYKYQWFFVGRERSYIEKSLGNDKSDALKMAQDDFTQWLDGGANIEDSGMVVYEVDTKTHTPYNEDRTIVGKVGNLDLIQPNPEICWN